MDTSAIKLELNAYLSEKNPIHNGVIVTLEDCFIDSKNSVSLKFFIKNFFRKELLLVFTKKEFSELYTDTLWELIVLHFVSEAISSALEEL